MNPGEKIVLFLLVVMISVVGYQSHQSTKAYEISVAKKWNSWVQYRDKNCKLTEKLIGISVPGNKMTYKENFNKYECENGLTYTIAESRENGKGDLADIPSIK